MESKENIVTDSAQAGSKPNHWKRQGDTVQVVEGYYEIYQLSSLVGKVLVKPGSSAAEKIEHWGLYSGYRWPSSTNTTVVTTLEYQGPHSTLTVSEFKNALPSGSIYVESTCVQETI